MENEYRKYYMREFSHFDGDHNITFNIVEIDTDKKEITVAITDEGKISHRTLDLKSNGSGLFFEYGKMLDEIAVNDFEHIEENEN